MHFFSPLQVAEIIYPPPPCMKEESLGLLLLTPSPDEAVSSLLA
jgi:hypothetical protein